MNYIFSSHNYICDSKGTINNVNSDENQSSFIQNLPDDNINEIEMFGTCDVPLPQPEATSDEWLKMSNGKKIN